MIQLILHLIGDFVFQNDNMASVKANKSLYGYKWCFIHCFVYTIVFIGATRSIPALVLIFSTHFLIDKYRLAYLWCQYFKVGKRLEENNWLRVYLIFMVDMAFHLSCNHWILNRF